jgi:hypothetical protein
MDTVCDSPDWQAVEGILDILVRIRIRGSVPLTNGSGSYSRSGSYTGSDPFFSDFKGAKKFICTGTGGAVCKGATPSVEQPGGRGFKPRLRSLLD